MPVVAAVERGRQLSRRSHIRIAVEGMTDLVRIFLVDARERKIGKPLGGVDVKHGCGCSTLCTHLADSEEQENCPDRGFHFRPLYTIFPHYAVNERNRDVSSTTHLIGSRLSRGTTAAPFWEFQQRTGGKRGVEFRAFSEAKRKSVLTTSLPILRPKFTAIDPGKKVTA